MTQEFGGLEERQILPCPDFILHHCTSVFFFFFFACSFELHSSCAEVTLEHGPRTIQSNARPSGALLGLRFLGLAALCFRAMDPDKLIAHQQTFLKSGLIEFDGGSIPILERFHYAEFLDGVWRGATVTLSPSALGYDSVSSWRTFSFLLPIILALHTSEVFGAYCSSTPETRHHWTWAWQMAPLWIGILNFVAAGLSSAFSSAKTPRTSSPGVLLGVLGSISSAVWLYTLISSPHPISELFIPEGNEQFDFILHTRLALQSDEVYIFAASFLRLLEALNVLISRVSSTLEILPQVEYGVNGTDLNTNSGQKRREELIT